MTQYDHVVEKQREINEAEAWGKRVYSLHMFNSNDTSMWYDRPLENGKRDGRVIDVNYNNGLVKREIRTTGKTVYIGKRDKGKSLLARFRRRFKGEL